MSLHTLRKKIKQKRQSLSDEKYKSFSHAIFKHFCQVLWLNKYNDIGLYFAMNGEVDTSSFINLFWQRKKNCYLPVIHPIHKQRLTFASFTPRSQMTLNQFGIPEPLASSRQLRPAWALDLILVPLVAFDDKGTRLGTGGGYYDRTLAHHLTNNHLPKPKLVGLAYEFQKVPCLPRESWDVPLDAVITEKQIYIFT